MLSYRHGFHAGNPADVFKHAVLVGLVRAMQEKNKGIRFVDTHAGPAHYDLQSDMALRTREFEPGIARLWSTQPAPGPQSDFLALIKSHNPDGQLRFYPGSPLILKALLRPQDELVLCELHSTEQKALSQRFVKDRQVGIHAGDGYAALEKMQPPRTGRGLVLIDPSFERRSELDDMATAMGGALRLFAHGVYVIWYPVIDRRNTKPTRLPGALGLSGEQWLDLRIEFPHEQKLGQMTGCGMAIINCPYRARAQLLDMHASWGNQNRYSQLPGCP